jgi:hypothetical protein
MTQASTPATAAPDAPETGGAARELAVFAQLEQALKAFAAPGGESMTISIDAAGRLVVLTADGTQLVFAGTEALSQMLGQRLAQFADELRMQQVDISRLLRAYEHRLSDTQEWQREQFQLDRLLSDVVPRDGSLNLPNVSRVGSHDSHLNNAYDAGRIGRGIGHLPPQPGEDFLFQSDDRRIFAGGLVHSGTEGADAAGNLYPDDVLRMPGTGSAINHLQSQPDDPSRFAQDARRVDVPAFGALRGADTSPPARQQPSAAPDRFAMREDGNLVGDLFANDAVPGSVRDVRLVGAAPNGILLIRDDGTFSYVPPRNFSGLVTFTYSFIDVESGRTLEADVVIAVEPVTDAAVLTGPATAIVTEEDTPVRLSGLGGALADTDGSETALFRITGVPAGAGFGGAGRDLGGGVWEFSADEIAGTLTFVPPRDLHGIFDLSLVAATREAGNGETVTVTQPFSITIAAVADAPALVGGLVRGNEDSPIPIGGGISFATTDRDGSEVISAISIGAPPNGWTASFTNIGTARVTSDGAGGYIISGPSPADIRATLDAFTLVPPPNADEDIVLAIAVTSHDANGSTATSRSTLTVVVQAVADVIAVSGGGTGNEDAVIALPVTIDLTDTDGSETISAVEVDGIPPGAILAWNTALAGLATTLSTGVVRFEGSLAEIKALLLSLSIRPAPDSDADFQLTIRGVTIESNPSEPGGVAVPVMTTLGIVPVTVTAVADVPVISGSSTTTLEDTPVLFGTGISFAVADTDGSERISKITIGNLPAGAVLSWNTALAGTIVNTAPGAFDITGSQAEIRALLDSLSVTPPLHDARAFTLDLVATVTDNDGSTATRNATHQIVVTPVADAPGANVGAGIFSTSEDTPVVLTGLGGALVDSDGSESLNFEITGLPPGSVFTSGTETSPGTWMFTPAEMLAGLTFDPPINFAGTVNLTLTATARETLNGSVAQTALPFSIVVGDVADPVIIPAASSTGDEDTAIAFGAGITYTLTDTDGSEAVSRVAVGGIPVGSLVTYAVQGAATVQLVGGDYVITGSQADIHSTLDSFSLTPPANSDADFALSVAVTTRESDGNERTSLGTHALVVSAVADQPVISGTASGAEDSAIALPITIALGDADGSETLTLVEVTGVPPGAALAYDTGLAGTVTMLASGLRFEGSGAQIQALLASLTITPPANSDADFSLAVLARSRESNPNGAVAVATADTTFMFPVSVGAVADAPVVDIAPVSGNEDSAIVFGTAISATKPDNDGSEWVSSWEIGAFPAGWLVGFTGNPAVTVTGSANGPYTLSVAAKVDEAALRAVLDSFRVTPPLNADADAAVNVRAQTTDNDGSSAWSATQPLTVVVDPISDAPVLAATALAVDEDASATFGNLITWTKPDNDGSERISRVELSGLPTGAGSAVTWTVAGTASVAADGFGGYVVTGPDEASIRATLDSFAVRAPANSDADFVITARAQTTDGTAAPSSLASTTLAVSVGAVADAPAVGIASVSGNEDSAIVFGTAISATKPDNDGSEWVSSWEIGAFPAGWLVGFTGNPAVTVTGSANGPYTLSVAAKVDEAALRAVLDSFRVTPPLNADADAAVNVRAQTTDNDGSSAWSATQPLTVVVRAVADGPTASASNVSGSEDTAIALVLGQSASADADGSETLSAQISGAPAGSSFQNGSGTAIGAFNAGIWSFTAAEVAAGIFFRPPTQFNGVIPLVLTSISTESATGVQVATPTAIATAAFNVTVNAVLDPVDLTNSTQSINEDTTIAVGTALQIALVDLDGSQSLSYAITGIPAGYTYNRTLFGSTTINTSTPGQIVFSGPNANDVINSIRSLTFGVTVGGARVNADSNFTLGLSATTVEVGGATSTDTATHAVTVRAVADATANSAPARTVDEDPGAAITFPITVNLTDLDGSETLRQVEVTRTSAAHLATIGYNTGLAGTKTAITNGWRFSGTTAQIQALLASVTVTPVTHNGSDITVRVSAFARESNPSEAGAPDMATLDRTTTTNYTINIVPVADIPTVSAPGSAYGTLEDARVKLTGTGVTPAALTGALVDADGSETLSFRITGVPAGGRFFTALTGGTEIAIPVSGTSTFTAAQFTAGVFFQPPANYAGTLNMNVVSVATETEVVTNRVATNTAPFSIVVTAVADPVTLSGSSTGNEDTAINFGGNIGIALNDADGSEYVSSVTLSGFPAGSLVGFSGNANVTVTGSGLGPYTLSIASAAHAAQLRGVLDSFSVTPPAQSDANITINVSATTTDAGGATQPTAGTHGIVVRAVADAPTANGANVSGTEDMVIALNLSAGASADADGTETLSARILDVPAGSVLTANTAGGGAFVNSGGGIWTITAPNTAQLNAILGSVQYTPPTHRAGPITMRLEVTSTEVATGGEVATATAVTIDPFTVTVTAVADMPTLRLADATGGAAGGEDTAIPLSISTSLVDADGSEVLSLRIAGVPTGASFVNGSGTAIGTDLTGGVWSFTQAELADIRIRPPLNSNDDFALTVTLRATESEAGVPGLGDFREVSGALQVQVIGVADAPNLTVATVNGTEDQPIPLGAAITGALNDLDGSETLYYVLSGLPAGVLPSVGTFIGGEWQISATDLALLTIPAPLNFSGNYTTTFAPNLKVRAVAQENDGDQAVSERPLNVVIAPVMDAFGGWSPSVTVNEGSDIPLSSAAFSGLSDNDGSEQIASYTFDLNGVIAAAQISGTTASVASFIASRVTGIFADNGNGTITVLAANLAGVMLRKEAFLDSNIDFTIPVSALVTEGGGLTQSVSGAYSVNLVGVADVPTAFADNVSSVTGTPAAVNLGGAITDTDLALGRASSERIYYIVSGPGNTLGTDVAFLTPGGEIAGLNNNDGTWYLTPADLAGLQITSRYGFTGDVILTLTSVSVENDGSLATNAAPTTFTASFTPDTGGSGGSITPLTPVVTVTPMTTNEDGNVVFTVTVAPAPGDPSPTPPTVSLFISNLPVGTVITGATLNPNTGRYIATADELSSGQVRITPPANFSGTLPITVEALAMNAQLNSATTGPQVVNVTVTPDADGPAISASPAPGLEDTATALNLSVVLADTDAASPEALNGPIRVTVSDGAILSAGTLVSPGVYDLTPAQLAGLTVTPAANWHGNIAVSVSATSREPGNGDTQTSTSNFTVTVRAAADMPNATANDVSGAEDSTLALTGLSAALTDTNPTNGAERLSVKIVGIPEGSILSAGANNGDGSWTIPVASLAGLTLKPPKDYSGVMNLSLQAFSLDADGSTATRNVPFTVTVTPLADTPTLAAQAVTGMENSPVLLNLGLKMADTNGVHPGENLAERIELTFTGLVTSTALTAGGGTLTQLSATSWRFTGTAAEAGTLAYVASNDSGLDTITVSAVSIDGSSRSAAVVDAFTVTTTAEADTPRLLATAAAGTAGSTFAINIEAALADTDGSETLSAITLAGVPVGVSFSAGTDLGGNAWSFTSAQLAGLNITLPAGQTSFSMAVSVTATEDANADFETSTATLAVAVGPGGASITGDSAGNTLRGGTGNDILSGGAGNDALDGGNGADILIGGTGIDILTGGTGADTLVWQAGDLGSGTDQVIGFSVGQNDRLDISQILSGYGGGSLSNFVQFVEAGGNTTINVDANGGAAFSTSLAVLQGVTGLNVETLRTSGHLIG